MFSPQVRSQGVTEELKCLSLLNALDKDQDIPDQLAQLFGEPCIKLAEGIKAYISKVRPKHSGVSFADFRWVLGRLCRPPPGVIWSRWWLEVSAWRNLPGNTERGGGNICGASDAEREPLGATNWTYLSLQWRKTCSWGATLIRLYKWTRVFD